MVTRKIVLFFLILLSITSAESCTAQSRIPRKYAKEMVNCCNEAPVIPLPFRTDGVYYELYLKDSIPTPASFFILYDDGTFYGHDEVKFVNFDSLFTEVKVNGSNHKIYGFKNFGNWGRYKVCGDTLSVQCYSQQGWGHVAGVLSGSLIILNGKVSSIQKGGIGLTHFGTIFIPYKNLPDPKYSWFRKQECIICDEAQKLQCK